MNFKKYIFEFFNNQIEWNYKITLPALSVKPIEPKLYKQGSHAKIYINDSNTLIKITEDNSDIKNIIKAQSLNSPNIVKLYNYTQKGVVGGTALLVEFVKGEPAPYSTPEFLGLMEGQNGNEDRSQSYINILKPNLFKAKILKQHGKLNKFELQKLSSLFKTIYMLEKKNIFLVDLSENIIDSDNYVIVDFGR